MTTLHPRSGAGLWLIPATATVVRLCGELDIGTGEAVRERLLRALRHSTNLLILDLSGVSFCDAAGLGAVVGVQHRARSLDITLGLAAPRPHLTRVLRLTGLDRSFPMYGTTPGRDSGRRASTGTGRVGFGSAAAR
ncbi:STAS domain-containing protein [Nonomuraea turcica]|uniref:STAS domain-containing protein n=1 Tax=Nonomuraea sp. G32 TaxID=3067274 RepID=UPI00273AC364|nr:STAS domain-containing protein [Nonomuraea sp. G32]MDP4511661.1 STAS domain-containing protein [Nonomuraea sp. G32]